MSRCKICSSSFGEDIQYHCIDCRAYVCFSCLVFLDIYGYVAVCIDCAKVQDDTICRKCRYCREKSDIFTCRSCNIFCCLSCTNRDRNNDRHCIDCFKKEDFWRCKECKEICNSVIGCNICHKSVCNGCLIEFIDVKRSLWICLSCNSQTKKDYVTREEYDTMVESLCKEINWLKELIMNNKNK